MWVVIGYFRRLIRRQCGTMDDAYESLIAF